jgi:hypothetical protein
MAKGKPLPPGTPAPRSGQYEVVGPRGGSRGREITATQGRPLPPVPRGERMRLVDPTKHEGQK